ncbi:MAG: hypothetical protein ACFFAI_07905 [Promethearchaeota archaeon]
MNKLNLTKSLVATLVVLFIFIPLISSFTIMIKAPQIKVEETSDLNISQAEIFDGMFINYTFDVEGMIINSGFSYEHHSGSSFNVSWWLEGLGTNRWVEDDTSRLISMSGAFDNGSHSPLWIFTDSDLYDLVPISVADEGDHIFSITKEEIFNIPGFGSIGVWRLEDVSFPEGIVWYEKSTGILIKGFFDYSTGNYSLDFLNTNAVFSNVQPICGLFEGLFMNYTMSSVPMSFPATITYTGNSINSYNNTIEMMGMPGGGWTVDAITRIMSNVNGTGLDFSPGLYTPFWILTNVSINDFVMISVDGEGDHLFQVEESLNLEFGNFGAISAWKLEDLTEPGGYALYEKNSGILINSTFVYDSGAYNYTFILTATNANFGYLLPLTFNLSSDATEPDRDGDFNLEWTIAEFAKNYTLYEYSSYISEINGSLTVIVNETTEITYHRSGYSNGIYFFIVAAKNKAGITLSNVFMVTVDISASLASKGIPGYSVTFLILAALSISMIWIKKKKMLRRIK